MAVSFVAVARVSDKAVLAQKAERSSRDEMQLFEGALTQLLDRAAALPAYPGWKDKVCLRGDAEDVEANTSGTMYALADSHALCIAFVGIKGSLYPERVARELLHELVAKIHLTVSVERLSEAKPKELTADLKGSLREAIKSYSDPAKVDKVSHVHAKVDQVKGLMQDNVKRILETHVTLEHLQHQSQSMTANADTFLKNSTAMRRQTEWRYLKVRLAVGVSIVTLAFVTGFPMLRSLGAV